MKVLSDLSWQIVSTKDDFLQLRNEWEILFRQNSRHSPFLSWGWAAAWLEHLAGQHTLCILVLKDDQQNIHVIVPLLDRSSSVSGNGRDLVNICGYGPECSDHLGVLYRMEHAGCLAEIVVEGIWEHLGARNRIEWNSMNSCENFPRILKDQFSSLACQTRLSDGEVSPTIILPESWEEFLQDLSGNFRSQVKRNYERILTNRELSMRSIDQSEVEYFAEALIQLNRGRMQDIGKESSLEDAKFRDFLVDVVRYMSAQEIAWMDIVENDKQIVGAALNFVHGDTVYYYIGGFKESVKKSGPGNALFARVIQRAIAKDLKQFSFLRGAESYKYRWGAKDVVDQQLIIYPQGALCGYTSKCADALQRLLRIFSRRR